MRRLTLSLLALAVLTAPAFAQGRRQASHQPTATEIQKKKDAAEIERRYQATIKATPAATASKNNDPWALVRGVDRKSGQK
ncbi:MAG TPA: hypothetical protein VG270_10295 [Pseudolabrys sp.]|jgi:outer membrane biogenesis lipoprotein LolB|nr:hypothetical protein [Pseudolabrys sp.]